MASKSNIAILASGAGTNAEAIMSHFKGHPAIEVALLLSNNSSAGALQRAKNFGIPIKTFDRFQFRESGEVLTWLREAGVTHIVLAGFLWLVPQNLLKAFPQRIINIHPALLPKFGGKGMYGSKVHESVIASGDVETGITIHEVNEHFDEGKVLLQATCPVHPGDNPGTIAQKVHALEHALFPKVIEQWVLGLEVRS
jgi:phosphoribosylglycinamide formyltransferase-1